MASVDRGEPSKSQRKRDAAALQELGERLVDLPRAALDALALSERLDEAVREARGITVRGARRRQLQRIGRIMRDEDADALRAALERLDPDGPAAVRERRAAEQWRTRFLLDGDDAVAEFIAAHPNADAQTLRRLIRKASRDDASGAGNGARKLFQAIREAMH